MSGSFLDATVGGFLDAVASREPAPGGGAVSAITTASAAALAAMAARFATGELAELAGRADELRARVAPLADADATAYSAVLAAYRLPRDQPDRGRRITETLRQAALVPLRIAETGAQVATLAAELAKQGNPNLLGDAQAAVLLADSATRAAAGLVRINVRLGELDAELLAAADAAVDTAAEARAAIGDTG